MTTPAAHDLVPISLIVNGDAVRRAVPAQRTLLELLRYDLDLTGSKQGCDKGDCGACTVVVEGEPVLACISLALAYHDGPGITTIEGVAEAGQPHPLQDALDQTGGALARARGGSVRS